MIIKCKICGGNLIPTTNRSMGTCESCGSTMTFPKDAGVEIANLYNRANHYRMTYEFDKAIQIYEEILKKDINDPEAYWGLVITKYGIDYVEDPKTKVKLPTFHRLQDTLITSDLDFLQAVRNAVDEESAEYYRTQGKIISELQKEIFEISKSGDAYDVFICYKETDPETGDRTQDSVDAQEIYNALTKEGIKVFFSRITLENILGIKYEPYIYTALRSAKIMLIIGSKLDYFYSGWVKNEWKRFYVLTKSDSSKKIFPCYKNINPYDLPSEFATTQGVDMRKIGFIQDLIRGVNKVLDKPIEKSAPVVASIDYTQVSQSALKTEAENLLKRAKNQIKDGDYDTAKEYYTRSLDKSPESFEAYLGLFLCDARITSEEYILRNPKITSKVLLENRNYSNAISFGTLEEKKRLISYIDTRKKEEEETQRRQLKLIKQIDEARDTVVSLENLAQSESVLRSLSKYPRAVELANIYGEVKHLVSTLSGEAKYQTNSNYQTYANTIWDLRIKKNQICHDLANAMRKNKILEAEYYSLGFLKKNLKKEKLGILKHQIKIIEDLRFKLQQVYDQMYSPGCHVISYIRSNGFNKLVQVLLSSFETVKISGNVALKMNGAVVVTSESSGLEDYPYHWGIRDILSTPQGIYLSDHEKSILYSEKERLSFKKTPITKVDHFDANDHGLLAIDKDGVLHHYPNNSDNTFKISKKVFKHKYKKVAVAGESFVAIRSDNKLISNTKLSDLNSATDPENIILSECCLSVFSKYYNLTLHFVNPIYEKKFKSLKIKTVNIREVIFQKNGLYYLKNDGELFGEDSDKPIANNILMISSKEKQSTYVLDIYGKVKKLIK